MTNVGGSTGGNSDNTNSANNQTQKKLDELINAYSNVRRTEEASQSVGKISRGKTTPNHIDRKKLIENGMVIDPDLIRQVAGDDKPAPTMPNKGDNKPKKTILKASSGEVINTQSLSNSTRINDEKPLDIVTDETVSESSVAQRQKEASQLLRRARLKYGNRHYNRLDPKNYTDEKIASDKQTRRKRRLKTIGIGVAVVVISALAIIFVPSLVNNIINKPTRSYVYNVCSEQDVATAIGYYNQRNVADINSYVNANFDKNDYSLDAKCIYISTLELGIKDIKSGVKAYYEMYNSADDANVTNDLIKEHNGPSMGELLKLSEKEVLSDEFTDKIDEQIANTTTSSELQYLYSSKLHHWQSLGNTDAAKKVVDEFADRFSDNHSIQMTAGDFYASSQINDPTKAINYYNRALTILNNLPQTDETTLQIEKCNREIERLGEL